MSTNFLFQKFVDNGQQCFAFTPQTNFPANNLNYEGYLLKSLLLYQKYLRANKLGTSLENKELRKLIKTLKNSNIIRCSNGIKKIFSKTLTDFHH